MCRWCVNDLCVCVCAWLCWAYFVHCCLGALRCTVMSCSFNLAYAPYGPHQGLSNLVFSCSLRTSSLAMGCSIQTLTYVWWVELQENTSNLASLPFLLLIFVVTTQPQNYNLENLTRELTCLRERLERRISFFHRMRYLEGIFDSNLMIYVYVTWWLAFERL